MEALYGEDLAYIHDVGHRDYALKSAPGILNILAQNNIPAGLIVDLGCGSGLSALAFTQAGYRVLGVDLSEALIASARARVPEAEFRVESLFTTQIPPCSAVTSIGECLNYLFDADNNPSVLVQLFQRIYQALSPGGVFVFDVAEPGQITSGDTMKGFTEGTDWIVLVEKQEDRKSSTLMRRIVTFRKIENYYRRSDEVHHLRLYAAADIAEMLSAAGFKVETMQRYGEYNLPKAHTAFVARKPTAA
jgi:SAM-dependent methyltransferase